MFRSSTGTAILYVDGVPVKQSDGINEGNAIATGGTLVVGHDQVWCLCPFFS